MTAEKRGRERLELLLVLKKKKANFASRMQGGNNDHELSDCFEDDWAAIGLSRSDITPEFLASASAIEDFHINFVDACDDEVDLGDNVQYGSENQLECKIELINISFADEDGSEYVMKDDVLKRFNLGYIRSK